MHILSNKQLSPNKFHQKIYIQVLCEIPVFIKQTVFQMSLLFEFYTTEILVSTYLIMYLIIHESLL